MAVNSTGSPVLTLPARQLHAKIYDLIEEVQEIIDAPMADALHGFDKAACTFFESLDGISGKYSRPLQSAFVNYQKALMKNDSFAIEQCGTLLSEEWSCHIDLVLDDSRFAAQLVRQQRHELSC